MSIDNIQKKRFLETIYKIYYSLGSQPEFQEISSIYGRYFSRFKPGQSIPVPFNDLNSTSYVDVDKLNRILTHSAFNLDVLYENYFEELEELYDLVSAFKFRINDLKSRRAELEKTVDDKLFALNNTSGFYYAFTEAFNNTKYTDLSKTTSVVDTESRKTTIPKENSENFNYIANALNKVDNAGVEIYIDGEIFEQLKDIDISNVFDGLNNSEWNYSVRSTKIGVCTMKLSIPIPSMSSETGGISVVEGKINSQKPVETAVMVIDPIERGNSLFFDKDSATDYDSFSFNFTTKKSSLVEIYFTKVEPDYIDNSNFQTTYVYNFSIEQLVIAAPYYGPLAIYVSNPIGLPSEQNANLAIDQVLFDANEQIPSGSAINYYIAADDGTVKDISQYNWIAMSPYSIKNARESSIVKFNGTKLIESKLINQSETSIESSFNSMIKIPRTTTYGNPIVNYFYQDDSAQRGFDLFRLSKFPKNSDPYEPYILESVDKNQIQIFYVNGSSLDRSTWQQVISGSRSDIVYTSTFNTLTGSQEFYQATNVPYGSIYLTTNVFMEDSFVTTKNFLKSYSAQYWDISIYLNGVELTSGGLLGPGILTSSLTWNFNKGQNSIVIIMNKSTNDTSGSEIPFNGSISLMEGLSLADLPNARVYKNYLSYVKIEDLRNKYSNSDNVFSIINYENNKEIVYRRSEEVKEGSRIYYFTNNEDRPRYVRVRADLFRGSDVYSSPAIVSYTLKFKH